MWTSNTWSLSGVSEQGRWVESAIIGDLDLKPNSSQSAYSVSKMYFPAPIEPLSTLSVSSLCPSQLGGSGMRLVKEYFIVVVYYSGEITGCTQL